MLHVLDPSSYSLGDVAAFRQRVRDRLAIAEIIADLSDTASDFFVEDALDRANTLMSSDSVVGTLSEAVRRSLGGSSGASDTLGARRALRVHIGETYRIHRRMLRSRRADPSIRDHLPRRNGAVRLACEDMARLESFDIIDTWRAAALREISPERTLEAATLMAAFVDAAFSHPLVLLRTLDERLNAIESSARPRERFARVDTFFDGELDLLRGRRALLEARIRDEPRAERLAQWLLATPKVRKAVVFVDDSLVANRVSDRLAALLGAESVLRQTTNSVHAFEESPRVRVLVCDASAEEGLNLQRVGAAVVHYDVPLSATRIEQRIGRTDRIAARGRPTNIVFEGSATYDTSWLQCLEQAIQIFDRSTAPLQYVVAGAIGRVRHHLLEEGATAFLDAVRAMMDPEGGLEAELRRIQHQEAIDALEVDSDANRALFEDMVKMDERLEDDGQDAFERWLVTTLQFTARHGDDDAVRYAYSVNRPTLTDAYCAEYRFM